MRVGDQVVCGTALGRVRAMMDHTGASVLEAGPSTPVQVLGFNSVPPVSESVHGVTDEKNARAIVDYNTRKEREKSMGSHSRMSLDALYEQIKAGELHTLYAIIKSDVQGSIEALKKSLGDLKHPEVKVDVIHAAAGGITESDVNLASASNAIVIGFNVRAETAARELADAEGVEIHIHHVIYDAINHVKSAMEGLLTPDIVENELGKAEVRETFSVPKQGTVAGVAVTGGIIRRNGRVRLYRENVLVWTGMVGSLRRFKDDVKEVKDGYECGVGLDGYNDIKVGDLLEFFEDVEVAKTID
jgi:translation initiation factor IF-2